MKIYKIKSEDKATLLNRLEKLGIKLNTTNLKDQTKLVDNETLKYFMFKVTDEAQIQTIDSVIQQSPSIDVIKENKLDIVRKLIKEELSKRKIK